MNALELLKFTQILLKFTQIHSQSEKGNAAPPKLSDLELHILLCYFLYPAPNLDDNSSDSQNLLKIYSNLLKFTQN